MYFLSDKRLKESVNERRSELKLMGIDENGELTEDASVYHFTLNTETSMQKYIDSIRSMYQEISDMNVGKRVIVNNTFLTGFTSPVDIEEKEREFITTVAEQLDFEMSDTFF